MSLRNTRCNDKVCVCVCVREDNAVKSSTKVT